MLDDTDVRQIADAVADALEARGLFANARPQSRYRALTVSDVAEMLGRNANWVRANAAELGAFRMGAGSRARLGFHEDAIGRWALARRLENDATAAVPLARRGGPRPKARPGHAPLIDYEGI